MTGHKPSPPDVIFIHMRITGLVTGLRQLRLGEPGEGVLHRGGHGGVRGDQFPVPTGLIVRRSSLRTAMCYPSGRSVSRFSSHAMDGSLVRASPDGAHAGGIFLRGCRARRCRPARHAPGHAVPGSPPRGLTPAAADRRLAVRMPASSSDTGHRWTRWGWVADGRAACGGPAEGCRFRAGCAAGHQAARASPAAGFRAAPAAGGGAR